jgi:C4-dicarboxylate transporter DctM subunit
MEMAPGLLVGILGFIVLFALIFLKLPIAFAMAVVGFLGMAYLIGFKPALANLPVQFWSQATSVVLMAIPLFLLMGDFTYHSGIGPDFYESASKWMGGLPGGLGIATTWGCAAFGACTGMSQAGILVFGPIAYEPMLNHGYSKHLALGTICCAATMGALIPPSIPFIVYASLTEESVGKLFIAGFIPGVLQAVLYSLVIIGFASFGIWSAPRAKPTSWKEKFASLKGIWGMLALFVAVLSGIYAGIFTPTEAGAIGAFVAFILLIIRRGFDWKNIWAATKGALVTSCMIFALLIGSMIFAQFIALSGLGYQLSEWIVSLDISPIAILLCVIFLYFILGSLMMAAPMMVLTIPILYPILVNVLGFDGIWFGVLVVVMVEIGCLTPPIGLNLFITKSLFKDVTMGDCIKGVMPFLAVDMLRLALLVIFPQIALWLPSTMK